MKPKHNAVASAPVTQRGDQTLNKTIRRKWFALVFGGLLFACLALAPSPLKAGCSSWDTTGTWSISAQTDDPNLRNVALNLIQKGSVITGEALPASTKVKATGHAVGKAFDLQFMNGNRTFSLRGEIGADGIIRGSATRSPAVSSEKEVGWTSSIAMKCSDKQSSEEEPRKPKKHKKKHRHHHDDDEN